MTNMQDLRKKSDAELIENVHGARKTIRNEYFKDTFTRKAGTIRGAKKEVARALTELNTRRRNNQAK